MNQRTRALRRANTKTKALRKQQILKSNDSYSPIHHGLGKLDKAKIHCSCKLCKEAKRTRRPEPTNPLPLKFHD